jgi:hypothetical protein
VNDAMPFGDATDEAVSAAIDGELAGFATEHGMTVDEVVQRLHGWSGYEARRHELAQARAAVATESLPLTPAVTRRLVEEARAASDPGSSRRDRTASITGRRFPWKPIAAAAAVVALVAGVGFALSRSGGGGSSASGKAKSAGPSAPKLDSGAFAGDVGDVSDPSTLRMVLTTKRAGLPVHAPEAASPAPQSEAATQRDATGPTTPGGREAALRCAAIVAPTRPGQADTVILLATARLQGRDAVVIGVRRSERAIVFVADRRTCEVLTSQSA